MSTEYLDYFECYEDTLTCLENKILDKEGAYLLIKHYKEEEHYECCEAILHAIEDYNNKKTEE